MKYLGINLMGAMGFARSTSNVVRNNTTNFTDVTGVVFPVIANATYKVRYEVFYTAGTTGDLRLGWSFPVGATFKGGRDELGNTSTTTSDNHLLDAAGDFFAGNISCGGLGTTDLLVAYIEGIVLVSSTAGTVQLRCAQNSATGAETTTVDANTNVSWWRIA